ncbi:SRPBCC family protein [Nocardia asiatica]|uniref:SRPBCC family protein n=1 Tax=Nocardia asiatica TaxID=209252 RepID=UPI003EE3C729
MDRPGGDQSLVGPRGWAATVYEMDVRPGSRWRFQIAPVDGSAAAVRSVAIYNVVVPRAELAYDDTFADEAWQPDGTDTFPTTVTFAAAGTGCTVNVAASLPDGAALQRAVGLQMTDGCGAAQAHRVVGVGAHLRVGGFAAGHARQKPANAPAAEVIVVGGLGQR